MTDEERNYYEILEVDPKAGHQEIEESYLRMLKKYDPAITGNMEMFYLINEAWDKLVDPRERADYDEKLNKPKGKSLSSHLSRITGECKQSDLFIRIVELLGKSRKDNPDLLLALIKKLGENPLIEDLENHKSAYDFRNSGMRLFFDINEGIILAFELYIAIPMNKNENENNFEPYSGNLTFGIQRIESRVSINEKIPGILHLSKNYGFDTDLRPFVITCFFYAEEYLEKIKVVYDLSFSSQLRRQ